MADEIKKRQTGGRPPSGTSAKQKKKPNTKTAARKKAAVKAGLKQKRPERSIPQTPVIQDTPLEPLYRRPEAPWERQPGAGQPRPEGNEAAKKATAGKKSDSSRKLLHEPESTFFKPRFYDRLLHIGMWVAVLGLVFFMCTAFFRVETVEVVGVSEVNPARVAELADVHLGDWLLFVRGEPIVREVEKLPYVDRVTIHRKLPNTLQICVQEAEPKVKMITNRAVYLLDGKCRLLEYLPEDACDKEVPVVITGLRVLEAVPGQVIGLQDDLRMTTLKTLLQKLKERPEFAEKVGVIHCESITDITISYDGRMLISIGDVSEINKKLDLVDAVLAKLSPVDHGYLYAQKEGTVRFLMDSTVNG